VVLDVVPLFDQILELALGVLRLVEGRRLLRVLVGQHEEAAPRQPVRVLSMKRIHNTDRAVRVDLAVGIELELGRKGIVERQDYRRHARRAVDPAAHKGGQTDGSVVVIVKPFQVLAELVDRVLEVARLTRHKTMIHQDRHEPDLVRLDLRQVDRRRRRRRRGCAGRWGRGTRSVVQEAAAGGRKAANQRHCGEYRETEGTNRYHLTHSYNGINRIIPLASKQSAEPRIISEAASARISRWLILSHGFNRLHGSRPIVAQPHKHVRPGAAIRRRPDRRKAPFRR
jgi:hypothetical protein